ncbi:ribonucleotide reductase inhibitor-domain-containing protein [Aspergillus crustosus]
MSATKSSADLLSKRRRFQPPITTFFASSSDTTPSSASHLSYNHYSAATSSPHPVLPGRVQASLLSVGMRVRKSVAEGYKTHHTKPDVSTSYKTEVIKQSLKWPAPTYSASSTRSELAPFSGMGKSNEYTQPLPHLPTHAAASTHSHHNYHYHDIVTDDNNDAFSLPPSSQESIDSEFEPFSTSTSTQRKRTHQDLSFDPYEDSNMGESDSESDIDYKFPRSSNMFHPQSGRTILSPTLHHQRRRAFAAQKQKASVGISSMNIDDFEEPTFLRRREEVDVDGEVQMSGIGESPS